MPMNREQTTKYWRHDQTFLKILLLATGKFIKQVYAAGRNLSCISMTARWRVGWPHRKQSFFFGANQEGLKKITLLWDTTAFWCMLQLTWLTRTFVVWQPPYLGYEGGDDVADALAQEQCKRFL